MYPKAVFTKEQEDHIITLYNEHKKITEIAKICGWCPGIISRVLISRDVPRRTSRHSYNRPYTVNHHYFQSIDTHEKAYFLGWLFADGCVYAKSNQITLTSNDIDVLENLKSELKCTQSIKANTVNIASYHLTFASEIMKQDLIRLGCVPSKSLIVQYPTDLFDRQFMWSFVCGYFEGDGMICVTEKTKQIKIISSTRFITGLKQFLESEGLIVSTVKTYPPYKPETSYITVCSMASMKRFHELAYANCKYSLARKETAFSRL